jgi:serine/threonine-protein kinase RsbW
MNDAFKHGNHCDIDKVVEFNLVDRGATFDFTNNPERAQPNSLKKIAGRGLFVVKSLADMVIREQEGSKVVLNFNLL